jgi:hypothetical protein
MGQYTGPRPVPHLIGLTRPQVYAAMRHADLFFVTIGPGGEDGSWNRVTSQSPGPGTMVKDQATIWLHVTIVAPPTTTTIHHPTTTTVHHPTTTTTVHATTTTVAGITGATGVTGTTTTTTHPPTTTTRPRPQIHYGKATWYSYIPGHCAAWWRPMGTRIWLMDLRNHKVVSCLITDREARRGRTVDLSMTQFAQLEPLRVGVIPIKVWWRK